MIVGIEQLMIIEYGRIWRHGDDSHSVDMEVIMTLSNNSLNIQFICTLTQNMTSNEGSTAPSKSLKSCTPIFQHFLILSINSSLYANNECHTTSNGDAVQRKHVDTCIHLLMGCYIHRMKMNENGEVVNHINQHLFTLHISNSMLHIPPYHCTNNQTNRSDFLS